jgi:hypothetical protein
MIIALAVMLAQEQVESMEYRTWADFKPGSSVTHKNYQDGADRDVMVKHTLKSVDEKEAVIETEMTLWGKPVVTERRIAAKVAAADQPKQTKKGEEEIDVAGKKMKCKWFEFEGKGVGVGGKVTVRFWVSDDVPGKTVRVDISREGGAAKVEAIATAWEKK